MAFGGGGGFGNSVFGGSSSAFGTPTPSLFAQSSAGFGASTPAFGAFGQSASAFGQSAPAYGQSAAAFGQSAGSFGGGFGAQPSLWGQSSSAFGGTQPFGASQPAFAASQSGFGQSQPAFGAQSQAAFGQPWAGSQQQPQQAQGTRIAKHQISHLHDSNASEPGKFMSISAMEQYNLFSQEELRLADYTRGDKGGENPSGGGGGGFGTSGFGAGGGAFGGSVFGQSASGFGSGFGAQSQAGLGAQSQPAFGAQSQPSLFAGANPGGFGASSAPSLFGPSQPQSGGLFGASTGGGFGNTGFGSTAFGQSSAAAGGFGGFGGGASSQSLFGAGNPQSGGLFGSQPQSGALFGSQPQGGGSFFGSQPQSGSGLFGSQPQSGGGLFGGQQQSGGGLFGNQPQSGGGLFAASSSAIGAGGAFGAPFGSSFGGGQQPAQSAPSLFGSGNTGQFGAGAQATTGSLFANTGASLGFGNTGGSLFGSAPAFGGFGASSSSLFGSGSGATLFGSQSAFGASSSSLFGLNTGGFGLGFGNTASAQQQQQQQQQQHQQQQGPLQADLTRDPFGSSQLFSPAGNLLITPSNTVSASVVRTPATTGQNQGKEISVVVGSKTQPHRRTRGSQLIARQSAMLGRGGNSWYESSPATPWPPERSLFNMGSAQGRRRLESATSRLVGGWRTEEQKKRAANIRRLVIEPVAVDPELRADSGTRSGLLGGMGTLGRPASERPPAGTSTTRDEEEQDEVEPVQERPASAPIPSAQGRMPVDRETADETEADAETTVDGEAEESRGGNDSNPEDNEQRESAPSGKHGEVEEFNSRYVRYNDIYKGQMRNGSRQSSEVRNLRNPEAPFCSKRDVYTKPPMSELEAMSADELGNVEGFTMGRSGIGEITWEEAVDLRRVDLDTVVRIEPKEICVYPREEDVPPKGEGLNKPAIVRLHGIWKNDRVTGRRRTDASTVAAIVKKLKRHCEDENLEFVGYEVRTGTWTFRAESF